MALVQRLRSLGHEAEFCETAASATAIVPHFQPDVIILDIGLPDVDGWRLAPLLRRASIKPILLVAISAFSTRSDLERSIQSGIDHHLTKPGYFEALAEILKQNEGALRGNRARGI
jgi:CheY-like chemotaxis protein